MTRKMFDKLVECFYPGHIVSEYVVLDRNKLDENNEWVKDSPALFVTIVSNSNTKLLGDGNVKIDGGETLSDFTGYDVVINKQSYLN
jgi:hypothetical protein